MAPKAQNEPSWIGGGSGGREQQKTLGPTNSKLEGRLELQKNSNIGPKISRPRL